MIHSTTDVGESSLGGSPEWLKGLPSSDGRSMAACAKAERNSSQPRLVGEEIRRLEQRRVAGPAVTLPILRFDFQALAAGLMEQGA
jgi:hypothetical protein